MNVLKYSNKNKTKHHLKIVILNFLGSHTTGIPELNLIFYNILLSIQNKAYLHYLLIAVSSFFIFEEY